MSSWFTYILRCADGTLYCGVTTDIKRRMSQHNSGKGAKYTRLGKKRPVELVMLLPYDTKNEAYSAEYYVKRMTRAEKLGLIEMPQSMAKSTIDNKKTKSNGNTNRQPHP